jgi:hypothetical protein
VLQAASGIFGIAKSMCEFADRLARSALNRMLLAALLAR